jgi:beta-lactamase regulating signal transducer with metallopeptidase domain/5-hydroxyisourate hydrolase-like protein (transthyretin family)
MTWQIDFFSWLVHAALSAFLLLAAGCLAVRLCRQPVRRLRLAELTLLGCLLVPWLNLVPGLPHYGLDWLAASQPEPVLSVPQDDLTSTPIGIHRSARTISNLQESAEKQAANASPLSSATSPAMSVSTPIEIPQREIPVAAVSPALLLVLSYLGLTAVFALWWLAGMVKLRQLCRSTNPAPTEAVEVLERIAGPAAHNVRLLVSDRLDLPLMFGWHKPVIVLPAALCRSGNAAELRYCLAHEWSHVEQRDIVSWHLASIVQLLFFYQPLFWWLRRQLRLCQDYLADAHAAAQAALAEDYAEYLVGLARRRLAVPTAASLSIGDRRSNLYRRIVMLITAHQPLERRCRRLWTAAAALTASLLFLAVAALRLDARADDKKEPPKAAAKEAPRGKDFSYTGRVFDKVTNKGIEGASVTVRRSIYGDHVGNKIVQETKHKTNAEGNYSFTIPAEQAADRYLYIELDVEAPGYAPRSHFGYSFAMIQKNEKMGGRPFFENVDLRAAKEITGIVETPDGKPASAIKVLAYSNADKQDGFEYGSFTDTKTDANGRFRLWLVTPGPAVFWVLPQEHAPSTHVIQDSNKRGDMGRFTLQPGLIVRGKVVDTQGKPAAGVFVQISKQGGIENFNLPVADHIRRTAVTDDKGEFIAAPLPPGKYEIIPEERGWDPSKDEKQPQKRPLPGVFVRKSLTLKAGEQPEPLEVRAVPHIVIEAQYYDSKGKPTRGHAAHMFGRMDKSSFWFGEAKVDNNGKMTLLAPHGLTEARLSLMTNEHGVLRHRLKKGEPLRAAREINLGTLDDDVKGIEIIRYTAPILIVDARDKDGKQIKDFKVKVTYKADTGKKRPGESFINGVQGDVFQEKQEDGRWRTFNLLPDEEVEVVVSANGYKSHTEKQKLAEGKTKELAPVLEKE